MNPSPVGCVPQTLSIKLVTVRYVTGYRAGFFQGTLSFPMILSARNPVFYGLTLQGLPSVEQSFRSLTFQTLMKLPRQHEVPA